MRFATLGRQSLWLDEAWTSYLVRLRPGAMIGAIPQTESTPPLYYLLAWPWVRVVGFGDAGLRALSAIAGTLTIPIAYAIGATLATRRVGLVLAALTATSPILVWYSQEARAYALLVALGALTLLTCARAVERPSVGRLALWVAASLAALATHYFAVFAILPEAAWLLARAMPRPRWARGGDAESALPPGRAQARRTVVAVSAVGIATLLLASLASRQRSHARWIESIPLRHRVGELPLQLVVGFAPGLGAAARWTVGAAVLAAVVLLARRARGRERRAALIAGAIGLATVAGPILLAAAGADYVLTRNMLVAWLAFALVVAAVLAARGAGRVGLALAGALCAVSFATVVAVAVEPSLQRPTWRTLASRLGPVAPGRAIVLRHSAFAMPLGIYRLGTWSAHRQRVSVREIDVVSARTPARPYCWWGAACNIGDSLPPSRSPVAGFTPHGRVSAGSFVISRFVAPRRRIVTLRALGRSRRQAVLLDGAPSPIPPR